MGACMDIMNTELLWHKEAGPSSLLTLTEYVGCTPSVHERMDKVTVSHPMQASQVNVQLYTVSTVRSHEPGKHTHPRTQDTIERRTVSLL